MAWKIYLVLKWTAFFLALAWVSFDPEAYIVNEKNYLLGMWLFFLSPYLMRDPRRTRASALLPTERSGLEV